MARWSAASPWARSCWCWARSWLRGFAENGFRLGSQLAWRYASFVFFAALVAGPACRIAAHFFPALRRRKASAASWSGAFAPAYGVYLLSVFLPNVIRLSAGAALMVLFGSSVALVMAVTAAPLTRAGPTKPIIPDKFRRVFLARPRSISGFAIP